MSVVKRVGVFSVGKVVGVLYALVGLIAGGVISMISLLGAAASGSHEGLPGAIFGVGAIVIIPLLYGATGLIGGIIMAALYNLIASMIGGVEVEITSG
jgi:hypothetical protein